MSGQADIKGLSVGVQVVVVVGVIIAVLLAVVVGVASVRAGRMLERTIDDGGLGFVESLQTGVAQEIETLRISNRSYVNIVVQRLASKRVFENQETIPIGDRQVPKIFIMDDGLQQITGDEMLVQEWQNAMGSQFSVLQVVDEGLVRVATTLKDSDGNVLWGSLYDKASPLYKATVENKGDYEDIVEIDGVPHLACYKAVIDADGDVRMVVFSGTSLQTVEWRVAYSSLGEGSYGIIFDKDGAVVIHPKLERGVSMSESCPPLWKACKSAGLFDTTEPVRFEYDFEGRRSMGYVQKVEGTDWYAMMVVNADLAMAPVGAMKRGLLLWTLPLAVVGLVLLAFAVIKLMSPLKEVVTVADRIAEGDLSMEISGDSSNRNEIKKVMAAFGRILEEYRALVQKVEDMNRRIAEGSKAMNEISRDVHESLTSVDEASKAVAEMVDSIAASAEETNAGVEEVSSGVASSTQVVTELSEQASVVSENAEEGRRSVEAVTDGTGKAGEVSGRVEEAVAELGKSVEGISGFVNTIATIADQTNLLALNAAIEAARAGDAGRGFAVVAEEVRKLAEESNEAASNIRRVIEEVQKDMSVAAEDTREAGTVMADLLERSKQAAAKISEVTGGVASMAEGIQSIAAASEEQTASTQEIARAIDTIASMLNGGRDSAKDTERAAKEMASRMENLQMIREDQHNQLVELRELTSIYRLKPSDGTPPAIEG
ncbi:MULTISPECIES: methyl-accepting chemotaxis protein [Dethiosulfovibrio]|uniref:Methyl-accepting chemotaxis protein n=2 Tax=Dethiosulfovibrio TaxID=47054 RepID=A0ABS9EUU0_9BACT|nr:MULTISPECIES: methyl-accepting chemotaxis protein [Dethiosulfovibrio]MCF4114524.1 methyl-accepting chemotaxis protein [Dethiosulfovibrio russensis]MCF4143508.1 methyl-accepting chemotaxis protein [Dethiosulfovibrio marinus]